MNPHCNELCRKLHTQRVCARRRVIMHTLIIVFKLFYSQPTGPSVHIFALLFMYNREYGSDSQRTKASICETEAMLIQATCRTSHSTAGHNRARPRGGGRGQRTSPPMTASTKAVSKSETSGLLQPAAGAPSSARAGSGASLSLQRCCGRAAVRR